MANAEYKLNLPEAFIPLMDKIKGDTINKKLLIALSINLFVNKTVSLEKAAQLSGESLATFIEILKEQDIPWMEYTEEHKKQDDKTVNKMMKELGL
jgi:predicted HTH domain antitoxin